MSTLLIDELYDGVTFEQNFRISKSAHIPHIRPWIYKNNNLTDGVFTCEVYDGATLLASDTIDYTQINAAITEDFGHGYIRFDFDPGLQLNVAEGSLYKEYTIKLYMDNHITDTNAFLAIAREWDGSKYKVYGDIDIEDEPLNSYIAPAGIEIYTFRSI